GAKAQSTRVTTWLPRPKMVSRLMDASHGFVRPAPACDPPERVLDSPSRGRTVWRSGIAHPPLRDLLERSAGSSVFLSPLPTVHYPFFCLRRRIDRRVARHPGRRARRRDPPPPAIAPRLVRLVGTGPHQ